MGFVRARSKKRNRNLEKSGNAKAIFFFLLYHITQSGCFMVLFY